MQRLATLTGASRLAVEPSIRPSVRLPPTGLPGPTSRWALLGGKRRPSLILAAREPRPTMTARDGRNKWLRRKNGLPSTATSQQLARRTNGRLKPAPAGQSASFFTASEPVREQTDKSGRPLEGTTNQPTERPTTGRPIARPRPKGLRRPAGASATISGAQKTPAVPGDDLRASPQL